MSEGLHYTLLPQQGKTYIGKVRATSSERDTLAFQLHLSRMLSSASWHPPGLPASAILCIRKFRDPLPGMLQGHRNDVRPPYAWEQAIAASLRQMAEHAARPIHGPVPISAEAALFADNAELLACLAWDWYKGTSHWWWQNLLHGQDIQHTFLPTWLDTPEYIPAALHHLAVARKAPTFVRALSVNDVRSLFLRIVQSFALREIAQILDAGATELLWGEQQQQNTPYLAPPSGDVVSTERRHMAEVVTEEQSETSQATNSTSSHYKAVAISQSTDEKKHTSRRVQQQQLVSYETPVFLNTAPWHTWVPESMDSDLSTAQQSLLGIGLLLLRAPAIVRTTSFAQAVSHWWKAEQHNHPINTPTNPVVGTRCIASEPQFIARNAPQQTIEHREIENHITHRSSDSINTGNNPIVGTDVSRPGQKSVAQNPTDVRHERIENESRATNCASDAINLVPTTSHIPFSDEISEQVEGVASDADMLPLVYDAELETEFGGLLYLINLGLFLNLYGDFTTPLQPGIALLIWDFVALLGQRLLGERIQADPLWSLLAQLAGRTEQELPGKDFEPPAEWRVPAEWLMPFPREEMWQWRSEAGRLRVRHPAHFLVLDVACGEVSSRIQQVEQEMQRYEELAPSLVEEDKNLFVESNEKNAWSTEQSLERWLNWLMPYIYARLKLALGYIAGEDKSLHNDNELLRLLCEHTAHIRVTATHVDITLSLAQLPIEIRMAGLDRNPGWVPAAARYIAFHFE